MKQLLIASVLLLVACTSRPPVRVEVTNNSTIVRNNQIVELDFAPIAEKLNVKEGEQILVTNENNEQIVYQITYDNKLIFPATVQANSKALFTVKGGNPQQFKPLVYGRFIPERKDDYAWENNRVAFRLYGPSLKPIDGPSNGVDVWTKRTPELIIDKWYKLAAEGQDYHTDRGEGLDCYKVGRTLGGGMPAPLLGDTLVLGENFETWERVDNGPLRTTVKLTYAPLVVGNEPLIETRQITLDAHSSFCKMEVEYTGSSTPLTVAAGVTLHNNEGKKEILPNQGAVLYWEKQEKEFGTIGTAIILPSTTNSEMREICGHLCALATVEPNNALVYYFGAGWDKFLHPSLESWRDEVTNESLRINQPLIVTIIEE